MSNILTTLIGDQLRRYGADRVAYSTIDYDGRRLVTVTWGEFAETVEKVACALEVLGVEPGDMIAIFSPNCQEILQTDFGCYRNRAVPVAIYATSSPEQVKYIVNDAGAKLLFVGSQSHYRAARTVFADCPDLHKIIAIDPAVTFDENDSDSLRFSELVELGSMASDKCRDAVTLRAAEATPDDIATLIYTSGTTGEPKGAILPHSCFNAAIELHHKRLDTLSDEDTSVCFLPLSHIFEKAWTYFCLSKGMSVAINPDPHRIQEGIRIARPTCMCSVPRFWEKVYTAVQEKIGSMKGLSKLMVERALKVGAKRNLDYVRLGLPVPAWLEMQYKFFDKQVFAKLRHTIGIDHGNIFPTAGAPLSATITEFLHSCGINIVIGYGLSETTATVSCYPTIGYEIGSVGTTLPGVEVKIGEENEILVKGPTVMRGYYGRPDDDAKAFTPDGWFRTGDAGLFDQSGALVLTERLKDLFKTSNGKYIAPQMLESRLAENKYIDEAAVIGDRRKFVTALIVPNLSQLRRWADGKGIDYTDTEKFVSRPEVVEFVMSQINEVQRDLASYEQIKRITLLPHHFSIMNGEVTNTMKVRRPVVAKRYAAEIEAMYE